MRRSDVVACDCLTVITFSNNLDPDRALRDFVDKYLCISDFHGSFSSIIS